MPLSLSLLPFLILNPPLLPVIICPHFSRLFFLFLFPFHPIYLLSYLQLYSSLSLPFSLSHFSISFPHYLTSDQSSCIPSLSIFSVVFPLRLIFLCSTVYFFSSISFKYYQSFFYSLCQKNFSDSKFSFLILSSTTHGTEVWERNLVSIQKTKIIPHYIYRSSSHFTENKSCFYWKEQTANVQENNHCLF